MTFSKRELEGYVEINHKESPGITEEEAARAGNETLPIGRGMVFQSATVGCSQCRRQIILNPLRTRERFWCSKCDAYHCDECAAVTVATGECKTMTQKLDEFIDRAAKGLI